MGYEQKTKPTDQHVIAFIEEIDNLKKREDAYELLDLFTKASGYEPIMWGPSIIGFGEYHYKYASGHSGTAPLVGFSPRKAKTSLYFATGLDTRELLLQRLGKHTAGKGCVYINKLADINKEVIIEFIEQSVEFLRKTYPTQN